MFKKSKAKKKKERKPVSKIKELIKGLVFLILIAAVVRIFVVYPFKVNNTGMQSSLFEGDYLLTSKLSYNSSNPEQGDIIVFDHPFKSDKSFVSRVIAVEGQTVEIVGKEVYVNNEVITEYDGVTHSDYKILPEEFSGRDYFAQFQVPSGKVFVLGDNRDDAEDSRNFGAIEIQKIHGKGLFVYFSWKPDPNAPEWESPYIVPAVQIVFYNLFRFPSRIRWGRLFATT
jgi:signal peptidase I